MSVLTVRGGVPHVFRASIDGTVREHMLPSDCMYLIARNKGAVVLRMFFTKEDATNDENYVELPVASAILPFGEWHGPVEADHLWFKSTGAASEVEVVSFQRRG